MTVFKVKAGDKISAESFNRITDAVNPGVGAMDAAAAEKRIKASWKNCGETEVPAGSVVTCRLRDASDPEKAKKRFLNDGFCLEGPVETDRKVYPTATLLKTARPGKIVPCMIEGLVAGLVKCNGEEEPTTAGACEIDANGCNFQAGKNGFAVLACTELGTIKGGSYRFCLMRAGAEAEWRFWITNDGASKIQPGDLVGIHSMTDSDLDPEEAIENWVNEGIRANAKLIGDIDDASAGRLIRAVSLDEIEPGDTGRAEAPGAFMARIWRDPNEFKATERCTPRAEWRTVRLPDPKYGGYMEVRRLACVRYPGEYILIDAAGPGDDDYLFGLLTPSLPGHIISWIVSADVESKRVGLSCGLTASFPVGVVTEDLVREPPNRVKAAVSRGVVNREWEILAIKDTKRIDELEKRIKALEGGGGD